MIKKGFTLIELLAVIIILAIIALIAVPQILDIIETSRKRSMDISADNYTKTLVNSLMQKNLIDSINPKVCELENGITICDGEKVDVSFDGNIESAKILIDNGKIDYYIVYFNDGEYAESGATPDSCFISLIPGQINDYICDYKSVVLSDNLKLRVSKIKSITYNDEKCKNYYGEGSDQICPTLENIISSATPEALNSAEIKESDLDILAASNIEYTTSSNTENILISKTGRNSFFFKNLSSISLNKNIIEVSDFSFRNNNIIFLKLNNELKKIGQFAFEGNKLTEVKIPDGVEIIGEYAFRGEDGKNIIKKLKLGLGLKEIKNYAFYNNCITQLEIPNSVTNIESSTFGCNDLDSSKVSNYSNASFSSDNFQCYAYIRNTCQISR